MKELIDKLERERDLTDAEFRLLLECDDADAVAYLAERAVAVRKRVYGTDVYVRGLVEATNYCRNDCLYCGIRRSNRNAERYRLTPEEILACAAHGYDLGFRTIVLQGGEDPWYSDETICAVIRGIKAAHPDCAVTLSIGEKSREQYETYYAAGADRYLLRHETADAAHYSRLHPPELTLENRMRCLRDLKEIGYQTGCGMMVGSPFQTTEHLIADLRFLRDFDPQMVGIGPFIPQHDTPFRDEKAGTLEMTLRLLSIIRLLLPNVLLPATTALGTIDPQGREKGLLAGANVVMPNLSPTEVRAKYLLYDNKICTGHEAAECMNCLAARIEKIGFRIVTDRGDYRKGDKPTWQTT